MKKDSTSHTSQDYDRKHKQDHISSNPRAGKGYPSWGETADMIFAVDPEDKREEARHKHTNHFSNRATRR